VFKKKQYIPKLEFNSEQRMTSIKYSSELIQMHRLFYLNGKKKKKNTSFWWAQTTSVGDKDAYRAWFFSPLHFFLILQPVLISIYLSHSVSRLESVSVCQLTITHTILVWTSIPTPRHTICTISTRHHTHLSCYIPPGFATFRTNFVLDMLLEVKSLHSEGLRAGRPGFDFRQRQDFLI
jgi:hypothetical protein